MCNREADIQKVLKYPEQHGRTISALLQLCYSASRRPSCGSVPLQFVILIQIQYVLLTTIYLERAGLVQLQQ